MKLPDSGRYEIDKTLSDMKRSDLGERFAELHRELQKTDKSMLVIIEGWESSGKGFLLKDLTRELDTRKYEVAVFEETDTHDAGYPYLRRFMKYAPKNGQIMFFDRSFYYDLMSEHQWDTTPEEFDHLVEDIQFIEHALRDDDTLIVKFFLQQTEEEMHDNIEKLKDDPYRHVRLSDRDHYQLKHYDSFKEHFEEIMKKTNDVPWRILYADGKKDQSREALQICIDELEYFLVADEVDTEVELAALPENDALPLSQLDLSKSIDEAKYDDLLDELQERAGELLYQTYIENKSVIVVYEGTDAAGKGGNIRRLTRQMDPRGYDVATVASPDASELARHYLWRFYRDFPSEGRMTIFDRSWYGRVLVERVEELTPVYRWQQAYEEINQMEHNLVHQGILVLKYLIIIDKDEQLERFKDRQEDPMKQYKLTDEDWRNREEFDDYVDAMNEMVVRTSTDDAPWLVVSGTDKKYARITVLQDFIKRVEAYLKDE